MSNAERLGLRNFQNDSGYAGLKGIGQQSGSFLRKGDYIPEIFFMGQIVGGQDFNIQEDGVFVECYLNSGVDWEMFDGNPLSVPIQTHTSYADEEGFLVFAHPFEYHFRAKSAQGWPKMTIKVHRFDSLGKIDNIAYGTCNLPN